MQTSNIGNQSNLCSWCNNEASELHHLFRRSSSPELIEDKNNLMMICSRCHRYATENKEFEQLLQTKFFLKDEKELSLENIQTEMRKQESLSPKQISDYRRYLAGEYSFLAEMLEWTMKNKPAIWLAIRQTETVKSDTQADRQWDMTEQGLKERELRSKIKRCEKLMSALKTLWELTQGELRNNY